MTIARRRTMVYLAAFVGLAAGSVLLRDLRWTGTDYSHILLETMAALVAFMVGALALARYYSKKENAFLLIGSAFVGTGCLDGYHAVATAPWLADASPSSLTALIPWSWLASRLFLSLMLWLSWLAWTREARMGEAGLIDERGVYLGIGAVTLASVLFFAVVPTPSTYAEWWGLSRPQELVPAAFFLMALVGYLRKGEWRHNAYEHWLILSLLVGTMGQAAIMPTSHRLYDAPFIVNHLLKLLSYLCVLVGLTANASELFRRAETSAQEARRATDALREAHDQLDARVRQRTEELQRLNDTLQESEQRFRTLADSAPVMIWMSDTEKRCVYLNRVWLEFTGRALEQDLGHGWVEHVHPDERTRCRETFGAAFDARQGFVMDYRLRRHDGAYRWVLDKGVPRFTGDGQFAGFIGTCTDITERKQAEELWLNITKGVSAATGETFFRSLVEYLAGALDADYVFVGAVIEDRADRVRTIAVWAHGAIADNFEYDLIDTPCEHVVGQRLCSYPSGVQRQFPKDAWLAEMGIDAYVGTPLFDSTGRPLGLMVALYGRALPNAHVAESVLQIFAARAASELERTRAEDALQAHELRLEQQLSALVRLMDSDALRASDGQAALRHVIETDARTLGVERVSVWRYNQDRTAIRCIELYELSTHRHSSGAQLDAEAYPSYFRALNETTVIAADDAHRDPRTCEFSDTYLRPLGITSMLDAPIHVNGVLDGVLCHEHIGPVRRWTPDEKTLAIAVANIVSLVTEQGERKRAEESLRDSEARFRQVTEHIKEVFWLSDPEKNRILYVSSAYEEIWGRTCESLYGSPRSWLDAIHADDRPRVLHAALTQQIAGQYDEEYRIVRPDESVRWIRDRAFPIRDASRRVYRLAGLAEDITERKQAEEALVIQARVLESMAEGVSLADEQGFIRYTNPAEDAMFGYRPGELIGRHVTVLNTYPQDENARIVGHVIAQLKAHGTWSGEFSNRKKDGTAFTTFAHITALEIANKTYWVCVQEDITGRKQAEDRLRQSEERYRGLVDTMQEGLGVQDKQGLITYVNQRLCEMVGYAREELLGKPAAFLFDEENRKILRDQIERRRRGERQSFEIAWRRKDGSKVDTIVAPCPRFDAEGNFVESAAVITDITERKRLEEALRQAQKMEAVGRLAGGIAHDFNNLLTIILGQSHRLLKQLTPRHPMQRILEEIKHAGERAASLTTQLLAFSRKQVLQPKTLALNDLVTNMEELLRRLIGEHMTLTMRLDPALGHVKADPGQLEQVVMNLVLNARDAMPRGGTITLATKLLDIQETDAAAQAPPGRYVSLVVNDTGQGMDADTQARIFEPFFTTKVLGRGTGLGLSMVYGIVAQSGGFISVLSQPGCGATFTICLPQVEEAKEPEAVHPVAPAPPGSGETILLVEDEPEVREFVRDMLEEAGYGVLAARDGVEALALAEQQPAFALLLTDVVMPRLGGRELAERLAARRPSLRVLYMSGYTDDVLLPQDVPAFIQKPFSAADLLKKIRTSLEQTR